LFSFVFSLFSIAAKENLAALNFKRQQLSIAEISFNQDFSACTTLEKIRNLRRTIFPKMA